MRPLGFARVASSCDHLLMGQVNNNAVLRELKGLTQDLTIDAHFTPRPRRDSFTVLSAAVLAQGTILQTTRHAATPPPVAR